MKEIPPPLNPPLNQCWIFCKISVRRHAVCRQISDSSHYWCDRRVIIYSTSRFAKAAQNKNPSKISFRSQFCSGFILLCIDFLLHFQAIHSNLAWQGEVFTGNCDFWSCCEKCFCFDPRWRQLLAEPCIWSHWVSLVGHSSISRTPSEQLQYVALSWSEATKWLRRQTWRWPRSRRWTRWWVVVSYHHLCCWLLAWLWCWLWYYWCWFNQ